MNRDFDKPLTQQQLAERVTDNYQQTDARHQREEEIARFAEERQKMIASQGIDSYLQQLTDLEQLNVGKEQGRERELANYEKPLPWEREAEVPPERIPQHTARSGIEELHRKLGLTERPAESSGPSRSEGEEQRKRPSDFSR